LKNVYLVDANVLLRYLMNDPPAHGSAAKKLIEDAASGKVSLLIPFIAVSETIFTLQRFYGISREAIGREFVKVLTAPGIKLTGPAWILAAVEEYGRGTASFGDACMAAEARTSNLPIASFDRDIDRLPGVRRIEPKA
jgi:predicted nucleic acid-binding protein